LLYGL